MRDEHVINLKGKDYITWPGLLAEAHRKGIKSIETDLLQIPNAHNGEVAISKAKVTLDDGTYFEGHGDASPANVGRAIAPHIIRMSETRAKSRALRDATNIDAALHDDPTDTPEAHEDGPQEVGRAAPGGGKSGTEQISVIGIGEPVTKEQLDTAVKLAKAAGWDEDKIKRARKKWSNYSEVRMEDEVIANLEKEAGLLPKGDKQ